MSVKRSLMSISKLLSSKGLRDEELSIKSMMTRLASKKEGNLLFSYCVKNNYLGYKDEYEPESTFNEDGYSAEIISFVKKYVFHEDLLLSRFSKEEKLFLILGGLLASNIDMTTEVDPSVRVPEIEELGEYLLSKSYNSKLLDMLSKGDNWSPSGVSFEELITNREALKIKVEGIFKERDIDVEKRKKELEDAAEKAAETSHLYPNGYITNDIVYEFGNGYKVVYLPASDGVMSNGEVIKEVGDGKIAFDRQNEGDIMRICLGSSSRMYHGNQHVMYSLRDTKSSPKITIRFDKSYNLQEARSKANGIPSVKLTEMLIEFMESKLHDYKYKDSDAFKSLPPVSLEDVTAMFKSNKETSISQGYGRSWYKSNKVPGLKNYILEQKDSGNLQLIRQNFAETNPELFEDLAYSAAMKFPEDKSFFNSDKPGQEENNTWKYYKKKEWCHTAASIALEDPDDKTFMLFFINELYRYGPLRDISTDQNLKRLMGILSGMKISQQNLLDNLTGMCNSLQASYGYTIFKDSSLEMLTNNRLQHYLIASPELMDFFRSDVKEMTCDKIISSKLYDIYPDEFKFVLLSLTPEELIKITPSINKLSPNYEEFLLELNVSSVKIISNKLNSHTRLLDYIEFDNMVEVIEPLISTDEEGARGILKSVMLRLSQKNLTKFTPRINKLPFLEREFLSELNASLIVVTKEKLNSSNHSLREGDILDILEAIESLDSTNKEEAKSILEMLLPMVSLSKLTKLIDRTKKLSFADQDFLSELYASSIKIIIKGDLGRFSGSLGKFYVFNILSITDYLYSINGEDEIPSILKLFLPSISPELFLEITPRIIMLSSADLEFFYELHSSSIKTTIKSKLKGIDYSLNSVGARDIIKDIDTLVSLGEEEDAKNILMSILPRFSLEGIIQLVPRIKSMLFSDYKFLSNLYSSSIKIIIKKKLNGKDNFSNKEDVFDIFEMIETLVSLGVEEDSKHILELILQSISPEEVVKLTTDIRGMSFSNYEFLSGRYASSIRIIINKKLNSRYSSLNKADILNILEMTDTLSSIDGEAEAESILRETLMSKSKDGTLNVEPGLVLAIASEQLSGSSMGLLTEIANEMTVSPNNCDYFIFQKMYNIPEFSKETSKRLKAEGLEDLDLHDYIFKIEDDCLGGQDRDSERIFESEQPTYNSNEIEERLREGYRDHWDNSPQDRHPNSRNGPPTYPVDSVTTYQKEARRSYLISIFKKSCISLDIKK